MDVFSTECQIRNVKMSWQTFLTKARLHVCSSDRWPFCSSFSLLTPPEDKPKMVANTSTTLEFIHSTPSSKPGQADRKRIRSHVLRARVRRSRRPVQKPWTNPELSHLPDVGKMSGLSYSPVPVPRCICSDIAMVRFPHEIEPYMLRDLHECELPL